MSLITPRRTLAILGGIVLVVGCYVGWQMYQGQRMANQYAFDTQKIAQGSGDGSTSTGSQAPGTTGTTPPTSAPSQNLLPTPPSSTGSQANAPSGTATPENYKQLMSSPYQQTLQAMQNVKGSTLALEGRKISLSSYKSSIVQSQATFAAAEAYVRANPPKEEKLASSYQEFLAGITLANQSMSVVLNGLSSLSPAKIYAAREMGITAQQQLSQGYSHL